MKNEYIKLIIEVDRVLSMLRGLWLDADSTEEAHEWYIKINKTLEERIRLMKLRDEKKDFLSVSDEDL